MSADYTYRIARNIHIKYEAGTTYHKVPSVVAEAIVATGAGIILDA